ncbi:zinc finger and SCAN domain-containing protein 31-like isoform X2 [Pararge aegeria]|uniref:zinc finger and SCAN domain-containing protein 31-like isoform X2 n=1 Tax=Pararge aegeria TaxID=116150 RepID=UPI0019D221E7|nr:zinc finger and SCAN domain-containing protein 31-like isoform X2 [Pararge aegeria]
MATKTWKIEKDLCRCCHAEGTFDNLAEPRTFLEKEEVYSDMLRECLDLDIPPVPGELCAITYSICNACITRLRDACNFKKQVQDCEQRFMTLYYKNAIQGLNTETVVKEELEVSIDDNHSDDDIETIVLKKEEDDDDDSFMDRDDDDDDMSEDFAITKKPTTSMKTRSKPKAKPKAPPVKKEKPQPQPKKKAEPKPVKEKKGGKPAAKRQIVFSLKPDDYRTKDTKIICSHCERPYDKMESLRFHVKCKHYRIPKHVCKICGKHFMTSAPFTIHKLEEHNQDDRIHCNACKKIFNTKVQLKKHINNFHMLGEKFKCQMCDYESFSFEGLYKHRYVHKTEKDYKCKFCRKAFVRKTTLDLHERIHTGDRRKVCKVCNQAFVQKASLNYHMNKYHPEVKY